MPGNVNKQSAWDNFIQWSISETTETRSSGHAPFEPDPLFSRMLQSTSNNVIITLMDVRIQQYLYISPNCQDITGWSAEELMAGGVRFFFEKLHPDDVPAAIKFSELINAYFSKLPENEKSKYSGQWDYRVCNRNGVYTKYTQRDHALKYSTDGRIEQYLVFFSGIENYKTHESQHLRLTNGVENYLYKHDHKSGTTYMLECLTKRELEIIVLISKSFSLKEIAVKLGISFNTVKNHSNNILKKLEAKDSMEAVNLVRVFGFM